MFTLIHAIVFYRCAVALTTEARQRGINHLGGSVDHFAQSCCFFHVADSTRKSKAKASGSHQRTGSQGPQQRQRPWGSIQEGGLTQHRPHRVWEKRTLPFSPQQMPVSSPGRETALGCRLLMLDLEPRLSFS